VHLRAGGTSLLVDLRSEELPVVVHWGADLGDLDESEAETLCTSAVPAIPSSTIDAPRRVTLLPQRTTGYAGRAALSGWAPEGRGSGRFTMVAVDVTSSRNGGRRLLVRAADPLTALELRTELEMSAHGLLRLRHALTNLGSTPYGLGALPAVLPVPDRARELLDFTGRHLRERVPQRLVIGYGAWVREQRRGRTGHDAPLVVAVGQPGFGNRHGELWAAHVGWSGNTTAFVERLPEGWSGLGGGELLEPGEVELDPGASYSSPWLYAAWSDSGLDGISEQFHASLRARPDHPRSPRPVVLNTWEAVYFEHDLVQLTHLADLGAELGVERFVLDDGWFGSRRNDRSGLGDWHVAADVWPLGLHPLVDHVRRLGMDFGLWVEPEMVNPDSDLARRHPDWLLIHPDRHPPTARNQHVLDVANPDVFDYLLGRLDSIVTEYRVDFLKWDHNRDLVDPVHSSHRGPVPGTHAQTLAVYRLLDDLRARHPGLEIESCAGGGGRVDLGVLARADRVWVSDTNDPIERQGIQRWTGLLVPPELMGAHVGPPVAHTTGRAASLDFRAGTAVFGHMGIEWDIAQSSQAERGRLRSWIAFYKQHRGLLHSGVVVNGDVADGSALVHGVVAADRSEGIYAYVQLTASTSAPPAAFLLPGLDPQTSYQVRVEAPGDAPLTVGTTQPAWFGRELVLPGSVLTQVGLPPPAIAPEQLFMVRVLAAPKGAEGSG
jgi:alpha-galactosidase